MRTFTTGRRTSHRRKSKQWTMVVYFVFVVVFVATITVQVTLQAIARTSDAGTAALCDRGVVELFEAVERAQGAAFRLDVDEWQAVRVFQQAREPQWSRRNAIASACRGREPHGEAVHAIIQWGYAEENEVRRTSVELSAQRRRARQLVDLMAAAHPSNQK